MAVDLRGVLEALYVANGGRLTAAIVVSAARPDDSPLHHCFTWDDADAAEKHRLNEARALIRSVKIRYVQDDEVFKAPRFVSVAQPDGAHAYKATDEIAADPVMTRIVLQDAIRQWRSLFARYKHLQGFLEAVQASMVDPTPNDTAETG